ncbi:hypothetical protein BH09PLA1_BH09PLA1_01490 [soil metagenome]
MNKELEQLVATDVLGDVADTGANANDAIGVEEEVDAEIEMAVPEKFTVNSAEAAAWVVRKIVAAREYRARVKLWADLEYRRAEREEERLMYLFSDQLRRWTEAEIATFKSRRRSIDLPSGRVGFRTVPSRLVVDDESAVIAWARRNCPSAIAIVERVSKSILNDHIAATGETPDAGVHIEAEKQTFYVK